MYSADKPLVGEGRQVWEDQLLKATASGNLPFNWVEDDTMQEVFRLLRPIVKLPTSGHLSKVVMNRVVRACDAEMNADILQSASGGTPPLSFVTKFSYRYLPVVAFISEKN